MTFRSPWIDPRVEEVRPAQAQAYLLKHGWKQLPPEHPHFIHFDGPFPGDDNPIVLVPTFEAARDYPQRMYELVTAVALAEKRYAPEVLNEMLQTDISIAPVNGSVLHSTVDTTTK
jgi:hypothetical protein